MRQDNHAQLEADYKKNLAYIEDMESNLNKWQHHGIFSAAYDPETRDYMIELYRNKIWVINQSIKPLKRYLDRVRNFEHSLKFKDVPEIDLETPPFPISNRCGNPKEVVVMEHKNGDVYVFENGSSIIAEANHKKHDEPSFNWKHLLTDKS